MSALEQFDGTQLAVFVLGEPDNCGGLTKITSVVGRVRVEDGILVVARSAPHSDFRLPVAWVRRIRHAHGAVTEEVPGTDNYLCVDVDDDGLPPGLSWDDYHPMEPTSRDWFFTLRASRYWREGPRDSSKARRVINRDGLHSVMNNAKWDRLSATLAKLKPHVAFRWKFVFETSSTTWSLSLKEILGREVELEWMEVASALAKSLASTSSQSTAELTQPLCAALVDAHVPFTREEADFRIWGYVRPGIAPDWVTSHTG